MTEELIRKVKDAISSPIIGNIIFDEDELDELKKECIRDYGNVKQSWSKSYKPDAMDRLIVLLVNTAKQWDDNSEGRFWTRLFGEALDGLSVSPVSFYDEFSSGFQRNGIPLFRSKTGKTMYREVFLLHALAPTDSVNAFIRLLWKWYIDPEVLCFNYTPDDPLVDTIANFLSIRFSEQTNLDADISFEGNTYAIRSSFKYLFTQNKTAGTLLLHSIFNCFNEIYFNGRMHYNTYIGQCCYKAVREWLTETGNNGRRHKRLKPSAIISDYSKIQICYGVTENGDAYLELPEIRAIGETADCYILEIWDTDRRLYRKEGYITGSDLRRRIKPIRVYLKDMLEAGSGVLHYTVRLEVLREDAICIYDSRASLHRAFAVFSNEREIKTSYLIPGTYFIVHAKCADLSTSSICQLSEINDYVATVTAEENDYIVYEGRQVFFNEKKQDSHLLLTGMPVERAAFIQDEQEYILYHSLSSIDITFEAPASSKSVLVIDGVFCRPLSEMTAGQEGPHFHITEKESPELFMPGVHCIRVQDVVKNKLLHMECYMLLPELTIKMPRAEALFDNAGFCMSVTLNKSENKTLNVCPGMEKAEIPYQNGIIRAELPYVKWRIDDGDWNYGPDSCERYWHREPMLHNNCMLEIDNRSNVSVKAFCNNREIPVKNGKYILGDALTESRDASKCAVTVSIGKKSVLLFTVFNEATFDLEEAVIDIESHEIDYSTAFFGDEDAQFITVITGEDGTQYTVNSSLIGIIPEVIPSGCYDIEIYLKTILGQELLEEAEEVELGNMASFRFTNKCLRFIKMNGPDGKKIKFSVGRVKDISYLRTDGNKDVYNAVLDAPKWHPKVELYVEGNIIKCYVIKGEDELLPLYYDIGKKCFGTDVSADTNDWLICGSIYYEEEE